MLSPSSTSLSLSLSFSFFLWIIIPSEPKGFGAAFLRSLILNPEPVLLFPAALLGDADVALTGDGKVFEGLGDGRGMFELAMLDIGPKGGFALSFIFGYTAVAMLGDLRRIQYILLAPVFHLNRRCFLLFIVEFP